MDGGKGRQNGGSITSVRLGRVAIGTIGHVSLLFHRRCSIVVPSSPTSTAALPSHTNPDELPPTSNSAGPTAQRTAGGHQAGVRLRDQRGVRLPAPQGRVRRQGQPADVGSIRCRPRVGALVEGLYLSRRGSPRPSSTQWTPHMGSVSRSVSLRVPTCFSYRKCTTQP